MTPKLTSIFDYRSYKKFVRDWIESRPKRGHGQLKRMADHLGVGSVLMSQVFNGDRELSEEQACELAVFLNLLESETRYFLTLVRLARAGSKGLREHVTTELDRLRSEAQQLRGRIKSDVTLGLDDQAIFYSDWFYSAIRLAVDIPEFRDVSELSEHLGLTIEKTKHVVEFLLRTGLCENSEGILKRGPALVYLPADSPFVIARQKTWRLRAFQRMETATPDDFYFTCPLTCSAETAEHIRKTLMKLAEDVLAEVKVSPSEDLVCLNIDWFRVGQKP